MIISASYRTDIPAFYATWFRNRLLQGGCVVSNPYGGPDTLVPLTPDKVDGYVFWTRNPAPFRDALDDVHRQDRPFVIQMTITGYPRLLDRSVIDVSRAISLVRDLSATFGRRVVVWRYDPVLLSDLTPAAFHEDMVDRLAGALSGSVDEVVMSMTTIYRKTRLNLDRALSPAGIRWHDPSPEVKREVLDRLGRIALGHGLTPTLCSQPEYLPSDEQETDLFAESPAPSAAPSCLRPAICIDVARLSDVAGRPVRAPRVGNRPGCLCARSRDIGAYETCPHGCAYCYAVGNRDKAKMNLSMHSPEAETLTPPRGTQHS